MERILCDPASRITLLIEERRREYQEVRCRITADHIFERYMSERIELSGRTRRCDRTRSADLYFSQFIVVVGGVRFRTNYLGRKSMLRRWLANNELIALVADGEVHAIYLRALIHRRLHLNRQIDHALRMRL